MQLWTVELTVIYLSRLEIEKKAQFFDKQNIFIVNISYQIVLHSNSIAKIFFNNLPQWIMKEGSMLIKPGAPLYHLAPQFFH